MLNNKGFAVSSVLYTLLIAFLLFLGAALAQFSASSSLIGKANDDLVNGTSFEAMQVKPNGACDSGKLWFQDKSGNPSNTIIRIKSKYGTMYWPKDFKNDNNNTQTEIISGDVGQIVNTDNKATATSSNGKIEAYVEDPGSNSTETDDMKLKISFKDKTTGIFAKYGNTTKCNNNNYDCMAIYDLCD